MGSLNKLAQECSVDAFVENFVVGEPQSQEVCMDKEAENKFYGAKFAAHGFAEELTKIAQLGDEMGVEGLTMEEAREILMDPDTPEAVKSAILMRFPQLTGM